MPDLDERLRRVFDGPAPVRLDEVLDRASRSTKRRRGVNGRLVAAVCVAVGVLGGSIVLAASRPSGGRISTSTRSTTTSTPAGRQAPLRIRLLLDRTIVVAGTTIRGVALLTNTTHKTITVKACAADGWFEVGLSNARITFDGLLSPAVACAPSVKLVPGVNRVPFDVLTTYLGCTHVKALATSQQPVCTAAGTPPLPPGSYVTTVVTSGLPAPNEAPAAIHVTLLPSSHSGQMSPPALSGRDLQAMSTGGYVFSAASRGDVARVPERTAIRTATTEGIWPGSRVVAIGLEHLQLPSGAKVLVWGLLLNPPGSHGCISYGPKSAPKSCTTNVYVVAISAATGANATNNSSYSALLPPLPVWRAR